MLTNYKKNSNSKKKLKERNKIKKVAACKFVEIIYVAEPANIFKTIAS